MASHPDRRQVVLSGAAAAAATMPAIPAAAAQARCSAVGPLLIGPHFEQSEFDRSEAVLRALGVFTVDDLPPCFSRVITEYLSGLDSLMPDEQRLRLRPYAGRLAGTAGTVEVERRRAEYLALATVRVVAARALHHAGHPDHASACEAAPDLRSAGHAAAVAQHAIGRARANRPEPGPSPAYGCAAHAANACSTAAAAEFRWVPYVAEQALWAMRDLQDDLQEAGRDASATEEIWETVLALLDGLFAIGDGQSHQASCAAGRAALVAAEFDMRCWDHEPEGGSPPRRRRLLAPHCTQCAGWGAEWVPKSELDEWTLAWLDNRARQSADGQQIEVRCSVCSGDGRFRPA
jgi:hypothetical protein